MAEIANTIGVNLNHAHGKTSTSIMQGILTGRQYEFKSGLSIKELHNFMPIVNCVKENMKPDVTIEHNGRVVMFVEENSYKNDEHKILASINKACLYANFHCRYLATCNVNSPGYCLHLPSAFDGAHTILSIALLIRCEWSYEHFCFVYTAECLVLDDIKNRIITVINQLTTANFQQRDRRASYYLFRLNIGTVNTSGFFRHQNFTCIEQCFSGNSIVLKVSDSTSREQILKFVSDKAHVTLTIIKERSQCEYAVFYENVIWLSTYVNHVIHGYQACLPPLTEVEAILCLHDFDLLIVALDAVHNSNIEHCDIRLENICFDPTSGGIRFIDFDHSVRRNLYFPKRFGECFHRYAKSSCMYSNLSNVESLDIHQLGYMILWLTYVNTTANGFHFAGNAQYHKMDEFTGLHNVPQLVQQMIRRGTIHDDGVRCVNDLPGVRRLQDVLAARQDAAD